MMCVWGHRYATVCIWKTEDDFSGLILSFCCGFQGLGSGYQYFYPLSHLSSPSLLPISSREKLSGVQKGWWAVLSTLDPTKGDCSLITKCVDQPICVQISIHAYMCVD